MSELETQAPGAIIDHELVKNDDNLMNDALKPHTIAFGDSYSTIQIQEAKETKGMKTLTLSE